MLLDRRHAGAVGLDAAGDLDLARRAARLDAQGDGRKADHDALDQGRAGAAEGLDAAMHDELADRLADLDADGTVGMGGDAVELRDVHGPGIDIEAARALAEGFDRRVDFQFMHNAEIHKTNAARAIRGDFCVGGPAIDDAPIVEHHVVDAIGYDRASIAHDINMSAVNREDAAGDLVRRAGCDPAIAVDRIGLQTPHVEPTTLVAGAADKDAAAANRRTVASSREADEVRADDDAVVGLHVPERERAVDDIDAVAVRPFFLAAGVSRDNVEAVHIDMAAAHLVARQNLHTSGRCHVAQFDPAKAGYGGIVEDRALVRRRVEPDIMNPVIGRQLKTISSGGEGDGSPVTVAAQRLSGRKANGGRIGQAATNHYVMCTLILDCRNQLINRGD